MATTQTTWTVPFNRPSFVGKELDYIKEVFLNGHASGDGVFTRKASDLLAGLVGAEAALLTTSGTHALEMACLLADVQPGDEVIVPAFTFVSTANAFALRGARIVFADIRPDTLNLDETLLADLGTARTKVVVPVHYAGVGCEMDAILAWAAGRNTWVVEDNAHGLLGSYRDRPLGSLGHCAALSFHETKNFSCGEGGALLINDRGLLERAEIIREKGTNRSSFHRGQVDKYTWVDIGSSYLLSDILAAVLYCQLEHRQQIMTSRRDAWHFYHQHLALWAEGLGVGQPVVPAHCKQPYHIYYLIMPDVESRTRLISHLAARGIMAVFHYMPLNASPMGERFGGRPGQCPVAEDIGDRLLRLPLYNSITGRERDQVVDALLSFDG